MKLITMAAIAAAFTATPALAANNSAFVGPRVEATAGVANITKVRSAKDFVYGAAAGVDLPLGDSVTIGADVNTNNVFDHNREIGASARLGYAFTDSTLGYVRGGYNNYRNYANLAKNNFHQDLDGFVVGAGVEYVVLPHVYVKAEYRYSGFSNHVGDSGVLAGVGFRF
jgi:outer membrane immunogenic protein